MVEQTSDWLEREYSCTRVVSFPAGSCPTQCSGNIGAHVKGAHARMMQLAKNSAGCKKLDCRRHRPHLLVSPLGESTVVLYNERCGWSADAVLGNDGGHQLFCLIKLESQSLIGGNRSCLHWPMFAQLIGSLGTRYSVLSTRQVCLSRHGACKSCRQIQVVSAFPSNILHLSSQLTQPEAAG